MGERERRIARNEATFRAANEELRANWEELEVADGEQALFICECGDRQCTRVMRLTLEEYELVRADPNTFAVLPGHDDSAVDDVVTGIVDENDRFAIVRKRNADVPPDAA